MWWWGCLVQMCGVGVDGHDIGELVKGDGVRTVVLSFKSAVVLIQFVSQSKFIYIVSGDWVCNR